MHTCRWICLLASKSQSNCPGGPAGILGFLTSSCSQGLSSVGNQACCGIKTETFDEAGLFVVSISMVHPKNCCHLKQQECVGFWLEVSPIQEGVGALQSCSVAILSTKESQHELNVWGAPTLLMETEERH